MKIPRPRMGPNSLNSCETDRLAAYLLDHRAIVVIFVLYRREFDARRYCLVTDVSSADVRRTKTRGYEQYKALSSCQRLYA